MDPEEFDRSLARLAKLASEASREAAELSQELSAIRLIIDGNARDDKGSSPDGGAQEPTTAPSSAQVEAASK